MPKTISMGFEEYKRDIEKSHKEGYEEAGKEYRAVATNETLHSVIELLDRLSENDHTAVREVKDRIEKYSGNWNTGYALDKVISKIQELNRRAGLLEMTGS